ncbi:AraC-like DNA-binding protein [Oxalobacteraceae bacterium GrIS 2.11]
MRVNFPIVPARYYAALYELIQQEGVETGPLLEEAGVAAEFFNHPESLLSTSQVEKLVQLALEATKRPDLGLEFGRAVKLSSHSMVGYAMLTSPTVGYALKLCARYFNLILPFFTLGYAQTSEYVELSYRPAMPLSKSCFLFHVEAIVATVHWELGSILEGNLPPYSVLLSTERPDNSACYKKLTGATHHFGWNDSPGFKVVFPVEIASRKLNYADPIALKMAEARCIAMQRSLIKEESLVAWIQMILAESPHVMVSLADIAGMLHISERTLDRYLIKENVRFSDLKKADFHQKALTLLNDHYLSITQIAHQCWRRLNIDPPCRLNIDPGRVAVL